MIVRKIFPPFLITRARLGTYPLTRNCWDPRTELRMERLLLSVAPDALLRFKFALEYDRDYKDIEEYLLPETQRKRMKLSLSKR